MSEEGTQPPQTRAQWSAALREAADVIMSTPVDMRPPRAGAIAGALVATSAQRQYKHASVVSDPSNNIITLAVAPALAEAAKQRLLALNLPGIMSIETTTGTDAEQAQVFITPHPRPQA